MFFKKEENKIKYCHNCGRKLNEFGDCDECIEDIDMGILPPKYRNTIINTVLLVIDYLIISSFILYVLLIIGSFIFSYFIPLYVVENDYSNCFKLLFDALKLYILPFIFVIVTIFYISKQKK